MCVRAAVLLHVCAHIRSSESAQSKVNTNKADDMATIAGWLRALMFILRLKVGALLWCGTPCSSWTFLNRGTSGRNAERPMGNTVVESVKHANTIVSKTVLLIMVAACRHATWTTEQPMSSLMPRHLRMQHLRRLCSCWFNR